ncbi:hypothetical protein EV586_10941 [Tumebacillus sp. BK434]|nr:hypothetical protein EV586_10941 [Tumebacillus sp. BK434]
MLKSVTEKRPKQVIDHILEHGYITQEDLQEKYGYTHGPRAAKDVRDKGIPLETFRVKSSNGRSIGAYRFGDFSKVRNGVLGGRKVFSKEFKKELLDISGEKCNICHTCYEERYLQIDHRVPYEVSGDEKDFNDTKKYMLVCGTCNRQKSWSCEHCENWNNEKDPDVCKTCYWGSPEKYKHIALREMRRVNLVFERDEIELYKKLKKGAEKDSYPIDEYIKNILRSK